VRRGRRLAAGISFGQFNISSGSVREDGPYVAVVENRAPGETHADLFVVIEPAGLGSDAVCPELLKLISSQFGRPQYSLTGNLLQCLRAAQEHLRSYNKAAAPEEQAAAGASCLALRANVAYLAQVGPAVAYLRHDGHLRTFQPLEPEEQAALGTTLACSPCFSRLDLAHGDTLLLVSSRFRSLVDDETADMLLSLPPGEALPEIYTAARGEREFSALYLAVTGQLQVDATSERDADPSPESELGGPGGRPSPPQRFTPIGTDAPPAAATMYGGFSAGFAVSPASDDARARRRRLDRLTERRPLTLPRPALYTIAALLAIGLTGWVGMPRLLQAGQADRFTAVMQDARKQQAAATAASDPAQKRSLLERVQSDIVEARTLRPEAPDLLSVQAQALSALQTLDQVRPLPASSTVADLTTTQVSPRSILELAAGANLYLLDASAGAVYAFGTGSNVASAPPVFQAGKVIEGVQTGKALHIAMRAPTSSAAGLLYILDSNRRLFSLDESGTLRAVGLRGAENWKSAGALAVGDRDLYVLDAEAGQIWHYSPVDDAFTDPPAPMLAKADLRDGAQLAVTTNVYVSTLNGRLLRVHDGRLEDAKIDGIDHGLLSPQPPVYDSGTGLQYFADLGNQRIVATQGSDIFGFQYSGAVLQGLRAIALDPTSGLLYALSVQKLYAIPLR
jgi:hypothetical protein